MQLKQIARDALLKPLQAVSGIVERRHTLPILANVLSSTADGELFVRRPISRCRSPRTPRSPGKEGQAVTVGARKLQDLLRALPEDATLNVDAAGSKMTVRAGRSRFNLQTLPAADYPRIGVGQDQVQQLTLPQRDAARAASSRSSSRWRSRTSATTSTACCWSSTTDSLQAVATDGHRLSWASLERRRRLPAPGGDPAAQDRARARQAAGRQRRSGRRSTCWPTRCASASAASSS